MGQSKKLFGFNWLTSTSTLIAILLIIRTLKMNYSQILANLNSGYGFTDESWALNALRERVLNGYSSNSFNFSEPLVVLFWIAQESVYQYRVVGLIVLFAMVMLFFWKNITKSFNQNLLLFLLSLYLLVSILTIPSVFRFLLVTPSYQWTLLTCSVFLHIVLVSRQSNKKINMVLLNITITVLVFAMTLSRPTSGGVALISILLYIVFVESWKSKNVLYVITSQVTLVLTVTIFDLSNLRDRFEEYVRASRVADPNAYSLLDEILDVVGGIFILSVITTAVFIVTKFILKSTKNESSKHLEKKSTRIVLAFGGALILILLLTSKVPNVIVEQKYILIVSVVTAILAAVSIEIREYFGIFVISFLPYTSQFGSNTPAIGNIQILLLCQSLMLIGVVLRAFFVEKNEIEVRKNVHDVYQLSNTLLAFALIFSLMMFDNFAKSQVGNNFEKTLYPAASAKSKVNGLYYTYEKLQSLDKFAAESNLRPNEEVIDLSSFHPGLILYAGGIQFQRSIPDKYFIYNISEQIRFVMKLHGSKIKQQGTKILVETNLKTISKECVPLSNFMAVPEISKELKNQGFDPKVRPKGLYSSFPEDLTLYPNNALMVETCEN